MKILAKIIVRNKLTVFFSIAILVALTSSTTLRKELRRADKPYHSFLDMAIYDARSILGNGDYFLTSENCKGCHGKDILYNAANIDPQGNDVNVYDDWQATMMALSSKDPLWRAKVSHEVQTFPAHSSSIQNTCTSCHAPMGHFTAFFRGDSPYLLYDLANDSLGLDGVSCVACHMQGPDAGSAFTGQISYDTTRHIYGPYTFPETGPMQLYTGYTPEFGAHMSTSKVCASCHTLITDVLDQDGNYTGQKFIEQATYHEWQNSIFHASDRHCQSCHMPSIRGPVVIANNILNLPGRSPFNLHKFVGANSFMLQLMKANKAALDIYAENINFDSTIANTIDLLENKTLMAQLNLVQWYGDSIVDFNVKLKNLAGHKFPSGYPSRRAFVQFVVTNTEGDTVFISGLLNNQFDLIHQNPLYEPHYDLIDSEDKVQIYEMVMTDVLGNRTTLLKAAANTVKDNRLVPEGFSNSSSVYDTVKIVGIGSDLNFNNDGNIGSGTDQITYRIKVPEGTTAINVYTKVYYQSVPPSWVEDMFEILTPSIQLFKDMYMAANKAPVLVASDQLLQVQRPGVSVLEYSKSNLIIIYPNPNLDGLMNIRKEKGIEIYSIEIYDSSGRLIEAISNPSDEILKMRINSKAGQYFIRIHTNYGTSTQKIIKLN